jgi:hypothetical protein
VLTYFTRLSDLFFTFGDRLDAMHVPHRLHERHAAYAQAVLDEELVIEDIRDAIRSNRPVRDALARLRRAQAHTDRQFHLLSRAAAPPAAGDSSIA